MYAKNIIRKRRYDKEELVLRPDYERRNTGRYRGVVCCKCHVVLKRADDENRLGKAITYIQKILKLKIEFEENIWGNLKIKIKIYSKIWGTEKQKY